MRDEDVAVARADGRARAGTAGDRRTRGPARARVVGDMASMLVDQATQLRSLVQQGRARGDGAANGGGGGGGPPGSATAAAPPPQQGRAPAAARGHSAPSRRPNGAKPGTGLSGTMLIGGRLPQNRRRASVI